MTHPLREYILASNDTVTGFAARVGVSRQTLHRVLSGAQAPKVGLARRIVAATGGAVTLEALYGDSGDRIVDLTARRDDDEIDPFVLEPVIEFALGILALPESPAVAKSDIHAAVEAVMNTHATLASITTRRGPDRLVQALQPVLVEILKENAGPSVSADRLDRAVKCAGSLYFQALPLRPRP